MSDRIEAALDAVGLRVAVGVVVLHKYSYAAAGCATAAVLVFAFIKAPEQALVAVRGIGVVLGAMFGVGFAVAGSLAVVGSLYIWVQKRVYGTEVLDE